MIPKLHAERVFFRLWLPYSLATLDPLALRSFVFAEIDKLKEQVLPLHQTDLDAGRKILTSGEA